VRLLWFAHFTGTTMGNALRLLSCTAAFVAALVSSGCAGIGVSAREVAVALRGAAEVPPNRSSATGKGTFWVHTDRTLNGFVETSGMEATAAHLHLGMPGTNGPLALELVRTSSVGPVVMEHAPLSGASWVVPRSARFTDEQYAAFLAGEIYVHIHSAAYSEGEIRGQLRP
jgi:hypothetical protein